MGRDGMRWGRDETRRSGMGWDEMSWDGIG